MNTSLEEESMKKVAIIPLRKGSKSIKHKNRKSLLGRPLFSWCLAEAAKSHLDEVFVFTDDEIIIDFIHKEYMSRPFQEGPYTKIKVLERSEASATDTASTEMAMKEFVDLIQGQVDILCLLQATSPLTRAKDINKVLDAVEHEGYDSALTVVENKRFFWTEDGSSLNYDYKNRPRRQDFKGQLVENGAVYATTIDQFKDSGIRIGGRIKVIEMPEDTLVEIDEPADWPIIEALLKNRLAVHKKVTGPIKALVLDVDGVFTDGQNITGPEGELGKQFSLVDGKGLELLRNSGLEVIVMTSENSDVVKARMEKLKIIHQYHGVKDKYLMIDEVIKSLLIERQDLAYIGDDINDLANICSVGWGITPSNGQLEVKASADLILKASGGHHAIREAVQFILQYNKRFSA